MRCSVVTALTVLCLTHHLPLGAAQPQGQRDSQGPEGTEGLTLLGVADGGDASLRGSDGSWNASQASLPAEDGLPETLRENTATSVTWDAMIAASQDDAPVTLARLVIPVGPQEDVTTTPPENTIPTHQSDISITTHEDITAIPLEDTIVSTPDGNIIFTIPVENVIPTHQANSFITSEEDIITTTQEDIITTPQESITTISLGEISTSQEDMSTSEEQGGGERVLTTVVQPVLEDGRVPTRVDQLVICSCPELTPDSCRHMLSDITIDGKDHEYANIRKPVAAMNVVVHNVACLKEDHRLRNFSEGQFFFRDRGDIVLREADYLTDLRVNDFCADLRPGKYGDMKWTLKTCIPPPSVPRCCPVGQALRGGLCRDANAPALLMPPMSAGLEEKAIYWPVIKNHYHPLTCTKDPLKSIPLVSEESKLMVLPTGIMHIWRPADGHVLEKYTYPSDLCIDGHVDAYGTVVYSANICYANPEDVHHKVCDGHTCIRKCCQEGEEMRLSFYRCVPSNRTAFEPHFTIPPDEYRMVYGKPLCPYQTLMDSATVNSRGQVHFSDTAFSARDYCVDKFSDGRGKVGDKTMVCLKDPSRAWVKARKIAFPICKILSILFLLLTVICYCLMPVLLRGGGCYQLFHVLSLMLGYTFMFMQETYSKTWEKTTCFAMGIMLQFSFLATFFWLNVLCFEVWRKIRSLNNFRPASVIPIWVYVLYAFGVPLAIGTLTVCMQFFAPDDVWGVIKPRLAQSRCFFPDNATLFPYFYGPIAFLFALNITCITHTYWTYRKIEKNSSILKNKCPESNGRKKMPMEQIHRKRDYISDFKQQFSLLVLMSSCWVSEVLSMVIPPMELWAVTDLLNSLQGVFIFFIFVANRSKRKHLKKKFPLLFKIARQLCTAVGDCCCHGGQQSCLAPLNSFTSQVSRKLSDSSIVSNLSTITSSLKFSTSSFSVSLPDNLDTKRPSVFEPDGGITVLSLKNNSVPPYENGNSQC